MRKLPSKHKPRFLADLWIRIIIRRNLVAGLFMAISMDSPIVIRGNPSVLMNKIMTNIFHQDASKSADSDKVISEYLEAVN